MPRPPARQGNSAYAAPRSAALILNKRPGREQRADPVFMRNAEREGEEKRCGKKEQLARLARPSRSLFEVCPEFVIEGGGGSSRDRKSNPHAERSH